MGQYSVLVERKRSVLIVNNFLQPFSKIYQTTSYYKTNSSVDFVWVIYLVKRIGETVYQVLTQKKLKDVKREKLEEALAIYTATDKVIKEKPK
jgi:hypothetical protein